jgi:hypothetical protein
MTSRTRSVCSWRWAPQIFRRSFRMNSQPRMRRGNSSGATAEFGSKLQTKTRPKPARLSNAPAAVSHLPEPNRPWRPCSGFKQAMQTTHCRGSSTTACFRLKIFRWSSLAFALVLAGLLEGCATDKSQVNAEPWGGRYQQPDAGITNRDVASLMNGLTHIGK